MAEILLKTTAPKLVTGLVAWNSSTKLKVTLPFLLAANKEVGGEIWILENGSKDQKQTLSLLAKYPEIKVFISPGNLGFAAAHNFLMQQAHSEFYFCANPDLAPDPDYLVKILEFLKNNSYAASAQGRLYRWDSFPEAPEKTILDSTGIVLKKSGKSEDRDWNQLDYTMPTTAEKVFGCTGAAAVYRLSALEKVGYFDERFFAYKEDVDLAHRLRANYFLPTAHAFHIREVDQHAPRNSMRGFLSFRGQSLFLQKDIRKFTRSEYVRETFRQLYGWIFLGRIWRQAKQIKYYKF